MDKHTKKVMFSSKETDWATPRDFFDRLDDRFGFDLDPCASSENAKCDVFYTVEDDGLSRNWGKNKKVFVNPPYGRDIKKWIRKSYEESKNNGNTVVMLIPSRTDTTYWHEYCMKAAEIYFVKGRLKFGDATAGAPFPSAVVVFNWYHRGIAPLIGTIDR